MRPAQSEKNVSRKDAGLQIQCEAEVLYARENQRESANSRSLDHQHLTRAQSAGAMKTGLCDSNGIKIRS